MPKIHPTAIVDSKAELEDSVQIGPYSIIGPDVRLGKNCRVDSHVHIKGNTAVGPNNQFFHSCSIGQPPQDFSFKDGPHSTITIGESNVFREFCTVHGSTLEKGTVIGNHNYIMGASHIAHDVCLQDHILLTQGAVLGGHVYIEEYAYISSSAPVHPHVRVGTYSLIGGVSAVAQDVLPYTIVRGAPARACGLNFVGLRRAGVAPDARQAVKAAYKILYGENTIIPKRIENIQKNILEKCQKDSEAYNVVKHFINFAQKESKQGIIIREELLQNKVKSLI